MNEKVFMRIRYTSILSINWLSSLFIQLLIEPGHGSFTVFSQTSLSNSNDTQNGKMNEKDF